MDFSVIVPAHNEGHYLPLCITAIRRAAAEVAGSVEIIVVINRCTDETEEIALREADKVVYEEAKNLSLIRNAGAAAASKDVVVTIDADSQMHPRSLAAIERKLSNGKTIGGGSNLRPERLSLGIAFSVLSILPYLIWHRVSFAMFWCRREDFEAIGGFDPAFITVEDLDFAKRLKAYGKTRKKKWGTIYLSPITTSVRKFDKFGDWHLFLNPRMVYRMFQGTDRKAADGYWYDARSGNAAGVSWQSETKRADRLDKAEVAKDRLELGKIALAKSDKRQT